MKKYQKFYEMDIWKEGYQLQKQVFVIINKFPSEEKYGLWSQLSKSINSIIANIAEAHGRYHYADKIRVLYIARGELEETQSHLMVACSRGYTTQLESGNLIKKYEELKMQINRYISNQLKQKQNKN